MNIRRDRNIRPLPTLFAVDHCSLFNSETNLIPIIRLAHDNRHRLDKHFSMNSEAPLNRFEYFEPDRGDESRTNGDDQSIDRQCRKTKKSS